MITKNQFTQITNKHIFSSAVEAVSVLQYMPRAVRHLLGFTFLERQVTAEFNHLHRIEMAAELLELGASKHKTINWIPPEANRKRCIYVIWVTSSFN